MSLGLGEDQRSLCPQMSVTFLLVPPTASPLETGLPTYPTRMEGGEAESAVAAEDAVWRGETSLSVCLGFQENLPGGGGSTKAFVGQLLR